RNVHILAFDPDGVRVYRHDSREGEHGTRADVEACAVPWTDDFVTVEVAFAKRAAVVRAHIGQRIHLAVDLAQGDACIVHFEYPGMPFRYLPQRRDFDVISHKEIFNFELKILN